MNNIEVKDNSLCRRCLNKHIEDCTLNADCGKNGCPLKHHPLLHNDNKRVSTPQVNYVCNEPKLEFKEGPTATRTRLGWLVHGCYNLDLTLTHNHKSPHFHLSYHIHMWMRKCQKVTTVCKRLLCSRDPESDSTTNYAWFKRRYASQRYETGVLWKFDIVNLPHSLPTAKHRLICLEKQTQITQIWGRT